ncbi:hypothetical protein N9Y40_01155 [Porticoccaceae bacterium]|nr:hypothetical protein [Porticoccaceae bacterium]
MKWKAALTAEEAALLITDLSEYSSLAKAKEDLEADREFNPYSEFWQNWHNFNSSFNEAVELKNILWDEIHHAWEKQELGEGRGSILVLDRWCYNDECCDSLSKRGCKVTKKSLAAWIYEMNGLDEARMIYPNFDPNNLPAINPSLNNPVKEEISSNYPKKLQLAIEAYQHVYIKQGFGNRPHNKDILGWLNEKAEVLGLTYPDDGEICNGISKKVGEVLVQIIKPDEE